MKIAYLLAAALFFMCPLSSHEGAESSMTTGSDDAAASFERISGGNIDTGYSKSDDSFQSKDHYSAGPFAREKSAESQ